ncbi:Protein of unknown function [Propionibacterium freudenreichii]|nr:Protein of unknown function [Propionibacterium freudenreichii]CEG91337.1 Protein of unknown function [Propionibacterium freudenreichii]CEG93492.1 Protein of unknown function [Propionibacterium freudenreichii]CEG99497.1 Protein of unknown function [Propionibacterium freudenreichii]CEH00255.1 Protein of unknown function [Propionibacterium freudenreichii]
MTGEASNEQ